MAWSHTPRSARWEQCKKPGEPGEPLKLLLKSKEQTEQIKYLDLLLLRILCSLSLQEPTSPRGSVASEAGGSTEQATGGREKSWTFFSAV